MKTLLSLVLVGFVLAPACAKAPPNLTPQSVDEFNKTRVIKSIDILRDTAVIANGTVPPTISSASIRRVAQAHQSAVNVIVASATGWQATVALGLDELLTNLPANERATLAPYVALAKTLLNEVAR